SDFVVLYNYKELRKMKPIDVDVKQVSLSKFLEVLLQDRPLSYTIDDKTILITPGPNSSQTSKPTSVERLVPEKQQRQITGLISDETGEPLQGVSILEKGTTNGTSTN